MATTTSRGRSTRKKSHSAEVNQVKAEAVVEKQEQEERISTARATTQQQATNNIVDASGAPPMEKNVDEVVVVDDGAGDPKTDEELFADAASGDETAIERLKRRLSQARQDAGNNRLEGGLVDVGDDTAVVRISHTLENFTYGSLNFPVLKSGQRYRLPKSVAQYLDSLGYVWH